MYTKLHALEAVKAAVMAGKRVYWGESSGYEVKRDSREQWVIVCAWNKPSRMNTKLSRLCSLTNIQPVALN